MLSAKNILSQIKNNLRILIVIYTLLFGLLLTIAFIAEYYNIPVQLFTRDPTVTLGGPPYVGFISNIGMIVWAFTAAICFFSSIVSNKYTVPNKYNRFIASPYLLFSGLLTLLLLIDDMFMLHDSFLPNFLNIPEKIVYLGYLILVLAYLIKFRTEIIKNEYVILVIAFFFFGSSVLSDMFLPQQGYEFLFEDGLKLFGIVTWFIYFVRVCLKHHSDVSYLPIEKSHSDKY